MSIIGTSYIELFPWILTDLLQERVQSRHSYLPVLSIVVGGPDGDGVIHVLRERGRKEGRKEGEGGGRGRREREKREEREGGEGRYEALQGTLYIILYCSLYSLLPSIP